jgi:cell wall-associated NlpC family hydrolase
MRRLAPLVILTALVSACASTGAVPRPFPVPGGVPPTASGGTDPATSPREPATPTPTAPAGSADGYSISSTALSLRGAPYRDGGETPKGFDCSGFVQYVFAQHGVSVPRDVRRQFEAGTRVDSQTLEPGDLVFFTTVAPGASHVGISVGGDQFVHAPSGSGVVRVDNLSAQYWANRFVGAKRVN